MAGKQGGPGDDGPKSPDTNERDFDAGLVAAHKDLLKALVARDEGAFRACFAGDPGEGGTEFFSEVATPRLARMMSRYEKQDIRGEEATLAVTERIEERDPLDPRGEVNAQNVKVTYGLTKTGGSWKMKSLRADW
jgi:hypothetical protein